jgi:hypothetical protein
MKLTHEPRNEGQPDTLRERVNRAREALSRGTRLNHRAWYPRGPREIPCRPDDVGNCLGACPDAPAAEPPPDHKSATGL